MVARYSYVFMVSSHLVLTFVVCRLRVLSTEVARVTSEVGSQGKLGEQAHVPDVDGAWLNLVRNVKFSSFYLMQWKLNF